MNEIKKIKDASLFLIYAFGFLTGTVSNVIKAVREFDLACKTLDDFAANQRVDEWQGKWIL